MRIDVRKGYEEQRKIAYPSIEDQLDALWKGGQEAEAMRAKIAEVKAQFPKAPLPVKARQ